MPQAIEIKVPDIGDFSEVEVIDVMVAEGDTVAVDDPLITLESDKAAMDVPSPQAGRVVTLWVKTGDKVSQDMPILMLEPDADAAGVPIAEATPSAPASGEKEIRVPDIGDFQDVEVIEVMVRVGEHVTQDDALITLESDKAAMDVPSPYRGEVTAVHVKTGDRVSEGSLIAAIAAQATDTATVPAAPVREGPSPPIAAAPPPSSAARTASVLAPVDEAGFAKTHASPSVRKLARELGVDLGRVKATGLKDRVLADDVKAFVKSVLTRGVAAGPALPEVPDIDFAKFGEIDIEPLTRIQKISGPRLQASWLNLPHVTQHDEADITELEALRQSLKPKAEIEGVRLTPLAFLVKACVRALEEFPRFNASLAKDEQNLVVKKYHHIGFAADTPAGLVVPVIKDADQRTLLEIARELAELSAKAREGKLSLTDMQGATFTISSLGGIGGTAFTPIINAPEVAILGVSRSKMVPVFRDDEFIPRLMLPLSLSYDHRVIDGATAVRFTTRLGQILAEPDSLAE